MTGMQGARRDQIVGQHEERVTPALTPPARPGDTRTPANTGGTQ